MDMPDFTAEDWEEYYAGRRKKRILEKLAEAEKRLMAVSNSPAIVLSDGIDEARRLVQEAAVLIDELEARTTNPPQYPAEGMHAAKWRRVGKRVTCPDGKPGTIRSKRQVMFNGERFTLYQVKRDDGAIIDYRTHEITRL